MRERCRRDEDTGAGTPAASYARYSSDLQDDVSIEQQRKCRDAAAGNGHDLRPEFEFADRAVSGTRVDRAGFQALLAAARDRRFGVLYFESLSRLAREFVISMPVLKELVYVHKVRVISTSEGIDSDRAGWELMAFVRSWMHGEFLTALRAAVLRGQKGAVLADYSVGDWCLGYGSEPVPGSAAGRRGRNPKPRMRVVVREEHAAAAGRGRGGRERAGGARAARRPAPGARGTDAAAGRARPGRRVRGRAADGGVGGGSAPPARRGADRFDAGGWRRVASARRAGGGDRGRFGRS